MTVNLSGVGVVAGAATQSQLNAVPSALNFGSVAIGSRGTLALTLSNPTSVPANGLLFTATTGYVVSNGCAGSLNAYSTCPVIVSFAPASVGADAGTLTIQNSASTTPLTITLTGTGSSLQPQLTLIPASLNLGTVPIGNSSAASLTLLNSSAGPVNNIAVAVTSGFAYNGGCPATLNANSSCSIGVTFAPVSNGATTGKLTVTSSDPASPITAALTGNAIANGTFTLTVDGGSSSSVTVQAGLPASYSLLVTPNGGYSGVVALTCSADTPVQYAACSLVPPSVTLAGTAEGSIATISTVSASSTPATASLPLRRNSLWCFSPALLVLLVRRRRPAAFMLLVFVLSLLTNGCGGGGDPRIRYVSPGTYTFHVTATSTNSTPASQTVTLTLVVNPKP